MVAKTQGPQERIQVCDESDEDKQSDMCKLEAKSTWNLGQ